MESTNEKFKQQLLLGYLIKSADTFAICKSIVKANYFVPEFRQVVSFMHTYFDKYSNTPTIEQIAAETGVIFKDIPIVTKDQLRYCTDEIETFCQQQAITEAVVQASNLIGTNRQSDIGEIIRSAVLVSLQRDMGINYFDDPRKRLEESLGEAARISTGWTDVDIALGGGLARTEMILVSANSGGGKSITLANLAVNMVMQKLNVLYLSLEMSEAMVAQRFDTMFTGIPSVNWQPHINEITDTIINLSDNVGHLTIKRMPSGTNSNKIRSYLKEYELINGFVPDVLIVDYLDLMSPNESVSADNISEKDKRSTEQLRDILFDYDMIGATASQQNRAAIEAVELHQGHIAGGLTKVNTVDWYVSVVLTPTMKAAGEMMMVFLKTRSSDAVGSTVSLTWDNTRLLISDSKKYKDTSNHSFNLPHIDSDGKSKKKSLADIMRHR